jgi:thioredoxin-related protein
MKTVLFELPNCPHCEDAKKVTKYDESVIVTRPVMMKYSLTKVPTFITFDDEGNIIKVV